MRTPFDALVTERALHFLSEHRGDALVDIVMEHSDLGPVPTKNVCAKVSVELSDQIDQVVALLGINKRRFLEAAFIDAVRRSNAILEAEGVLELLRLEAVSAETNNGEAA